MTSPFDSLFSDTAVPVLRQQFGETVSLKRGDTTQADVTAQKFLGERLVGTNDIPLAHEQCDWIIAKSAYQISDAVVIPQSGDVVVDSDGTEWEVLPKGDQAGRMELSSDEWLIRTKRIV